MRAGGDDMLAHALVDQRLHRRASGGSGKSGKFNRNFRGKKGKK